jgi:hypothetical protein
MKLPFCPYLGLRDDPETHLAFPAQGNCCQRARPVESLNLQHQSTTCLCMNYLHCPMLATSINMPLPVGLKFEVPARKPHYVAIGLFGILIIILLGIGWWQGGNLARSAAPIPTFVPTVPLVTVPAAIPSLLSVSPSDSPSDTPTKSQTPFPTQTLDFTETPTLVGSSTSTPSPDISATLCMPPIGWRVYIVQANDNLFHIGLEFGVTVNGLQIANCLGNSVMIIAGQGLYVPNVATRTPLTLPTRTPTEIFFEFTLVPTLIGSPTITPVRSPMDTLQPGDTPLPTSTDIPSPSETLKPDPTPIPSLAATPTPGNQSLVTPTFTPSPSQ